MQSYGSLDSLLSRLHISSKEDSRRKPTGTLVGIETLQPKVLNEHNNNGPISNGYKCCISEEEKRSTKEVKVDGKENIKPEIRIGHGNDESINSNGSKDCFESGSQSSSKSEITANKNSWTTICLDSHKNESNTSHGCIKYVARGLGSEEYPVKENEHGQGSNSDSSVIFAQDFVSWGGIQLSEANGSADNSHTVQIQTSDIPIDLSFYETPENVATQGYSESKAHHAASAPVISRPLSKEQAVRHWETYLAMSAQQFEKERPQKFEHTSSENQASSSQCNTSQSPIPVTVLQIQESSRYERPIRPKTTAIRETPTSQQTFGINQLANTSSTGPSTRTCLFNTAGACPNYSPHFPSLHSQELHSVFDSQQVQQLPPPAEPQSTRELEGRAHRMVWGMSTNRLLNTENDTDLLQLIKETPYLLAAICARLRREHKADTAERLERLFTAPSQFSPKPPSLPAAM